MNLEYISTARLTTGELISLASLEVISVPHISIIDNNMNTAETLLRYKNEFDSLLKEIYQTYKEMSITAGYLKDISIELLWKTTEVQNHGAGSAVLPPRISGNTHSLPFRASRGSKYSFTCGCFTLVFAFVVTFHPPLLNVSLCFSYKNIGRWI